MEIKGCFILKRVKLFCSTPTVPQLAYNVSVCCQISVNFPYDFASHYTVKNAAFLSESTYVLRYFNLRNK